MNFVTLNVYTHPRWKEEGYDPTNGGVSSRLDRIRVFSEDSTDEQIKNWCADANVPPEDVCRLVKRVLWDEKHYFIEPVVKPQGMARPMFGGNFACSSNGLWADMLGERTARPLPIHDRFETERQNEVLSR